MTSTGFVSPFAGSFRGSGRFRNASPFRARGRAEGQWHPLYLGVTALYDYDVGGSSTQVTDSGPSSLAAIAHAASTASPTFLAAPSTRPYVRFPNVQGNYVTTPHAAALNWTTQFEVSWFGQIPSAPNGYHCVIGKGATGATTALLGIRWHTSTVGRIEFLSADGVSVTAPNANYVTTSSLPTDTWMWFNITHDATTTGAWSFRYNVSTDPTVEPTSWTTTSSGSAATYTPNTNSLQLAIGDVSSGSTYPMLGPLGRVIYRTTIGGTPVADFQAVSSGQTGYTGAYGNVWTVNYGTSGLVAAVKSAAASDVSAGVLTDGSNDYATGPTGAIPALTSSDACTLFTVTRPRATMTTNMTFFSTRSGSGAGVTLRMASATTVVADISDGSSTVTTPAVSITPGLRYVLGVVIPTSGGAYCFANNTLGATQARTGNTETGGALTVFATSTPANYCRTHSRVPYAAVPRALAAVELANLASFYGGGL